MCLLSSHVAAQDMTVLTAQWAPYMIEADGHVTGIATEIVQAMLEKAGIDTEIKVYPFARAYKMALKNSNTMLFPGIQCRSEFYV